MFITVESSYYVRVKQEGVKPACWINLAKAVFVTELGNEKEVCRIQLLYEKDFSKIFFGEQAEQILSELEKMQQLRKQELKNGYQKTKRIELESS